MRSCLYLVCTVLVTLLLVIPARGDAVDELVNAILSAEDTEKVIALQKIGKMKELPEEQITKAMKLNFDSVSSAKTDDDKQKRFEAVYMLAQLLEDRGGVSSITMLISCLTGPSAETNVKVEESLMMLSGYFTPSMPAGARKSGKDWVDKQTAWNAWWKKQTGVPGVKENNLDILKYRGVVASGVRLPNPEKMKATDCDALVNALLRGLDHQKLNVRHNCVYFLEGLLEMEEAPDFNSRSEPAKRKVPVQKFREYWNANKAKIREAFGQALKEG